MERFSILPSVIVLIEDRVGIQTKVSTTPNPELLTTVLLQIHGVSGIIRNGCFTSSKHLREKLHQHILEECSELLLEDTVVLRPEKSKLRTSPEKTYVIAVIEGFFRGKFDIKKKLSSIQAWTLSIGC